MNTVYFPVHVVVLLRRIFNFVSSVTISNRYILLRQPKLDADYNHSEAGENLEISSDTGRVKLSFWRTFDNSSGVCLPSCAFKYWDWPRIMVLGGIMATSRLTDYERTKGHKSPLPSISRSWPWFPFHSSAHTDVQGSDLKIDAPPLANNKPDHPSQPFLSQREDFASLDTIHQLLWYPALYCPLRRPRYPIVLCHGLYGFDSRGPSTFPSMRMHYWSNVLNILRGKIGAEVIVTSVPGTGSITSRSESLNRQLQEKVRGRGVNLMAHSMGGLDCRHLITHVKPTEYVPLSLTTISTPHRGSPFMDWCVENIGIGKVSQPEGPLVSLLNSEALGQPSSSTTKIPPVVDREYNPTDPDRSLPLSLSSLPSSFTTLILSIVDSPAYANLTTTYLNNVFNPATPDDPHVKYFSVASRMSGASVWHPFWLPKMVLDSAEDRQRHQLRSSWKEGKDLGVPDSNNLSWTQDHEWGNDGLVTVQSAKWGNFLGIMEGCDHWEMRGARGIEFGVDLPSLRTIGLGVSKSQHRDANGGGDGWGLKDWTRFVSAWRREEKTQRDSASKVANGLGRNLSAQDGALESERQLERDDAVIKYSTDRLSAVFDWLIEQVPSPRFGARESSYRDVIKEEASRMQGRIKKEGDRKIKNELATKLDLERFYVALSRKLYDEGL